MPYLPLTQVQTTDPGDPLTAAWCDTVHSNFEFLIDPPVASVSNSAAVSVPNNTATALNADTEAFDNDNMHSLVSNTSRLTAQTAGRFLCLDTISYVNAGDATLRAANFRKNGSEVFTGVAIPAINGNSTTLTGVREIVLNVGDYVEAIAQHIRSGGAALNGQLIEFAATFLTRI